ncbi:MAG TPA: biotin/lipoyl-containing protein [Candidatus Limnocylindrales bacterium]
MSPAREPVDPRAVRVAVAPTSALPGDPVAVVGPPVAPLQLFNPELGEVGVLGGAVPDDGQSVPVATRREPLPQTVTVDGVETAASLEWIDSGRAVLVRGSGDGATRTPVFFGPPRANPDGTVTREVVVGGWRTDLVVESERRAALRDRSRRAGASAGRSGPLQVRAIIPGRIVAVSVAPGDEVTAGQQLLVLEAMKMQNELRAPRDGTVETIAVAVGATVEVGDVLMVIG